MKPKVAYVDAKIKGEQNTPPMNNDKKRFYIACAMVGAFVFAGMVAIIKES